VAVPPGQGLEDGGAQCVQRDVDPVQAGAFEGFGGPLQVDAMGGQRQPGSRCEGGAPLDDPDEAGAQQRLAAGEADLLDAELGDRDPDQPYDLFVRE
jgi:hypothetical protein